MGFFDVLFNPLGFGENGGQFWQIPGLQEQINRIRTAAVTPVTAGSQVTGNIVNAAGNVVGAIPVLGDALATGVHAVGGIITNTGEQIDAASHGQNLAQSAANITEVGLAGAVDGVVGFGYKTAHETTPAGVWELPITSTVDSVNRVNTESAEKVLDERDYSKDNALALVRSTGEVAALAVGGYVAGSAIAAGSYATAPGVTETLETSPAFTPESVGLSETAEVFNPGTVSSVGTYSGSGELLSFAGTGQVAASAPGLLGLGSTEALAEDAVGGVLLGAALKKGGTALTGALGLGASTPDPTQLVAGSRGTTINVRGINASGGGGGGGGGGLGMSAKQASFLVAAGLAAVFFIKKG